MSFFITDALATSAGHGQQAGNPLSFFITMGLLIAVFYFLMFRPQQKRMKAHKDLVNNLSKGDEVATSGGIIGKITGLEEDFLTVEIAQGVEIKVQRGSVGTVLPKGTMKS
ncbi:MAG: preprotein translocase subunit YajC [Legionellales bacterium]|nr:preprotein translocase subunit YajC [Legionellales bacterium]|tara:strand:+ start:993 stop:1325 length:333 start_codon:yes stop_codon:yes gene_type:complete